jgi:hypothetical protein
MPSSCHTSNSTYSHSAACFENPKKVGCVKSTILIYSVFKLFILANKRPDTNTEYNILLSPLPRLVIMPCQKYHWKNFSSFGNRIDFTNKLNADLDVVNSPKKQVLVQSTRPNSSSARGFFLTTFVLQHWFHPKFTNNKGVSNKLVIGLQNHQML